jgi:predicted nucleic acid-binding protein
VLISDTSPLNYLVLIDTVQVLPKLFGRVTIPESVLSELTSRHTPVQVREFFLALPDWIQVSEVHMPAKSLAGFDLHLGERDVLTLALTIADSLILMDETEGRRAARVIPRNVVGTLGVLRRAASSGLISLPPTMERLRSTNFRMSKKLQDEVLGWPGV